MPIPTIRRYRNLIQFIDNWPAYFIEKSQTQLSSVATYITRRQGIRMQVPKTLRSIFKELFFTDFYQIRTLARQLPPNPIVLDVGANAGFFALQLFDQRPDARIFCFEPHPANLSQLQKNLALNPTLAQQMHIEGKAVSGVTTSSLHLYFDPDRPFSPNASTIEGFEGNQQAVEVPVVPLDRVIEQFALPHIDLLKLDCEGSEYDILYHSSETTRQRIRAVTMETHTLPDDPRGQHEALVAFLKDQGFRTQVDVPPMLWMSR
ncbi:methyltransferase, FkbM family [Catalinimonas alkaloidigena]|uniref:Methyltransferase, FkbM family n=1 Tax=Catalinimonas alkaloidigena TaxID=1075417 RepID=A0A1G9S482_9BACT|nr:FkbM family methyltransferase [Catalinimonas alkaloidigena]SDM30212.1 methyltransferase, FkbM family [Catalinimonas alkaloidigena]